MASTDPNIIPPIRNAGTERNVAVSTFMGTVTAVIQDDKGEQTLEVQFTQGKIKLKAEGDFQPGERVRLSFAPGSPVMVEKGQTAPPPPPTLGDWIGGASYTLPGNLSALRDVRSFEGEMAAWLMGGRSASGTAPGIGPEAQQLMRLPLPELLKQVLGRDGGKEFLGQALARMDANTFAALMGGLEDAAADPGAKASLGELLKGVRQVLEGLYQARTREMDLSRQSGGPAQLLGRPDRSGNNFASWVGPAGERLRHLGPGELAPYQPGETPGKTDPWFGRIVEKQELGMTLFPLLDRRGAGLEPKPGEGALYRYVIDMGGRTQEVESSQSLEVGEVVDFELERPAGGTQSGHPLRARFLDPGQALPPALRAAFAEAPAALRPAMQVAAHYLQEFQEEAYFPALTRDFAEVLAQSGRLDLSTAQAGGPGMQAPALPAPALPAARELDGLFKLFVAFPRDVADPARQARTWSEAGSSPQAMLDFLKSMRPQEDASLLRSGTPMRLADALRQTHPSLPAGTDLPLLPGEEGKPQSVPLEWLRKLPEAFKSADLLKMLEEQAFPKSGEDKEPAARFLVQALSGSLPREEEVREGRPSQFYFFNQQEWRGLQVTWQKGRSEDAWGKQASKAPLHVRVQTTAHHMGKVDVDVSWEEKGAKIDFRNQFHDVRELLEQSMPELERNLALLDFHIQSWTYGQLKDEAFHPPGPAWVRPGGLSDGVGLDLLG